MYRCSVKCVGHALPDAICGVRRQVDVEADRELEAAQRAPAGTTRYDWFDDDPSTWTGVMRAYKEFYDAKLARSIRKDS